ncbi:hypothetical protein CH275_23450 [Rhodococcus sp. 06-235-1A]|uniref:hypothetical protein n=1 Tax=Rhodococcus sp. 06-235-1A TaxID=2022508 RepID=UPI000B9B0B01|nr:hypothetical protein [Rhodococcus sp. 06-235-1A]OZC98766.1 hypothetical protein CH275_23450 [Rhodococcus sp. 06-235-1A]
MFDGMEEENSVKRRIAVVLGAAVIAMASPSVATADTGSASTGSASGLVDLIEMMPKFWEACGLTIFTFGCTGITTPSLPGGPF